MTTTAPPPTAPTPPGSDSPAGVLDRARAVVGELDGTLWAAKRPEELLAAKQQLEGLRSQLAALDVELGVEVAATRAEQHDGWASAGDYYTAITGGRRGSGAAVLRTAGELTGDREATLAALRAGAISWEQAQVVVRTVVALPVKPALRHAGEARMLEYARSLNATDLKVAGRALLEELDPEGSEKREEAALHRQERSAHLGRFLSLAEDGIGGFALKGRGATEDLVVIKAALFPLTAPHPQGHADNHVVGCPGATTGACLRGCPGRCEAGCAESGHDPREHSVRLLDALVEACQRLLDAGVPPESHGAKPRINVRVDYVDLVARTGGGTTDTGIRLSASAVRRMACDAEITAVVLGADSEVLDVSRAHRLVTTAIWKALVARDGHCRFPGCTRPPIACDAHHITAWLDGGGTSLTNTVLLCGTHHTMIHQTPWEVRINPDDRHPEFRPPRHLDPDRRWMRRRVPRE